VAGHVDVGVVTRVGLVLDVGDGDRDAPASIWSNAVNDVLGFFSDRTLVIAAVSVVFPWSM
jgi:hypothetical protein